MSCRGSVSRRLADLKTGTKHCPQLCDRYSTNWCGWPAGNCGRHPARCR